MPRSSTTQLSAETVQELENQFFTFLDGLSSDEKRKFFGEFLTNEEKMMMYKRLALYWCLLEGYPLAKIQQMIGVTHDTTRVYNKKKNMLSDEFKALVQRIGRGSISEEPTPTQEASPEMTSENAMENQSETPSQQEAEIVSITHTETVEVRVEEPQNEESHAPEQMNQPISHSDDFRIETREDHDYDSHKKATDEPAIIHPMEGMDQDSSDMKPAESHEEAQASQHHTEHNPEQTQMPESTQTTQQSDSENSEEEPQEEKKKSGLAKFFGF